jgi:hypothetical protein
MLPACAAVFQSGLKPVRHFLITSREEGSCTAVPRSVGRYFRSRISRGYPPKIEPSKQQVVAEKDKHKLIIGLMVIFFLGDPSLQTLAWLGEMKVYMVAAAIALVSIPFVTSQLDG